MKKPSVSRLLVFTAEDRNFDTSGYNSAGRLVGKNIHPHTLRQSFAINLVRNGVDIRRVQLLLGHANLNTTQVYLQFRESDIREAYDAIVF